MLVEDIFDNPELSLRDQLTKMIEKRNIASDAVGVQSNPFQTLSDKAIAAGDFEDWNQQFFANDQWTELEGKHGFVKKNSPYHDALVRLVGKKMKAFKRYKKLQARVQEIKAKIDGPERR